MELKVKEIFDSIQGEGPYVGVRQLFIRFCRCNLLCEYCDTDFTYNFEDNSSKIFTPKSLYEFIKKEYNISEFHSVSLTGGEPLLEWNFLQEFLPLLKNDGVKIYLETNATLAKEFYLISDYIDIVSADIKLKSSTGLDTTELHSEFFRNCSKTETFAKIVFDENITDKEIKKCAEFGGKYNIELILQPKMIGNKMSPSAQFCQNLLNKFTKIYPKTRLIPQVHKFLDVR